MGQNEGRKMPCPDERRGLPWNSGLIILIKRSERVFRDSSPEVRQAPFRFVAPLTFLGLSCFPIQALVFTSLGFFLSHFPFCFGFGKKNSESDLSAILYVCCQLFPWRFETVRLL
jgi:hypothetical protein